MNRINEKEYYAYMESHLSNGKYECIEFMLKGSEVNDICNIGPNDYSVGEVVKLDYVQEQIKDKSEDFLRGIIRRYDGTEEDYETREDLEMFLVWSAAWDIFDDDTYNEEDEQEAA